MLILFSILILLITTIAIIIGQKMKLRFALQWLIVAIGTLGAWSLVVMTGFELPQSVELIIWQPENLFHTSPALLVDRISWPYTLALMTLVLAAVLTDTVNAPGFDWIGWTSILLLSLFGMFAVLAGNPLTLLLAWMAVDVVELLILLSKVNQSELRERIVVTFSARTFSSMLVIMAAVLSASGGQTLTFSSTSNEANLTLLLAAGLRLGVIPLHIPLLKNLPLDRGIGTISRALPAAAGLMLVTRASTTQQTDQPMLIILGFAALAGFYSAVTWFMAKDELEGRPAWIVGMASLSFAAAVQGQTMASLSWGLSLLFGGGLLFLYPIRTRLLTWIPLVGLVGISAIPYTPNWSGAQLYAGTLNFLNIPFLLAQALLFAGYARHALRAGHKLEMIERWIWFIYPSGLILLLGTLFTLGFWMSPFAESMSLQGWLAGVSALVFAGLLFMWVKRLKDIPPDWIKVTNSILSLEWLYLFIWSGYRSLSRALGTFTKLLEGEGGVLWAILLLGLLFSIISRLS